MTEILALLQPLDHSLSKTSIKQMSRIIAAMIAMSGRITMLGISRWAGTGGSYRNVQRFFYTAIPWPQVFWDFFRSNLMKKEDSFLLAGDECVVTKSGKKTYGLDCFFSGLLKRTVPSLSFFTLSLVNVRERRSYPIRMEQTIRSAEEKAKSQAKKQAQKAKTEAPKRKRGRPKGSCNQKKADKMPNPELERIQKMIQELLKTITGQIQLTYLVLDGHFGNHPAVLMVRQCGMHLISKLRSDAALFFPYTGPAPKRGRRRRLGERLDYRHIPEQFLKETRVEDGIETRFYQLQLLNREFSMPLNVVILIKTNLETKAWAHVVLFSSDLQLSYDKLVDFYSLRFQIEFNFRDAKQYWGLEDFMNINPTAVTNAAALSLFMVNVSQFLMCCYRKDDPDFSILDLKAYYRGYRYVTETIKILPNLPDENLISQLFQKVTALGRIHPAKLPAFSG
jgi:putative transposase